MFHDAKEISSHPVERCQNKNSKGIIDIMLIGDSHSMAISRELEKLLTKENIGYYEISHSSCIPLPGFRRFGVSDELSCNNFDQQAFAYAKAAGIKTVVLTGRFSLYYSGNRFDNGEGGIEEGQPVFVDISTFTKGRWDDEERKARVLEAMHKEILALANDFNVVLVSPIPEAGWNVPEHAARVMAYGKGEVGTSTSYDKYLLRTVEVRNLFDALSRENPKVFSAQVYKSLCSDKTGRCVNSDADGVYYRDDDHLSNAGARLISPIIVKEIVTATDHAS